MAEVISGKKMQEALEWAYDKAINGMPGAGSAIDLAEDYMTINGSMEDKINSLIRWQNTKAGSAGFVTGLGGVATIPVNIASTLYIQIRMVAAIAHIAGHDIKHDKVVALINLCLLGNGMTEVAKDFGITFTTKFATGYIKKNITGAMLKKINQAVGFRLITKSGTTGLINLTKTVPVLGGVVGCGFDVFTTNIVGNQAKKTFLAFEPINLKYDESNIKDVN